MDRLNCTVAITFRMETENDTDWSIWHRFTGTIFTVNVLPTFWIWFSLKSFQTMPMRGCHSLPWRRSCRWDNIQSQSVNGPNAWFFAYVFIRNELNCVSAVFSFLQSICTKWEWPVDTDHSICTSALYPSEFTMISEINWKSFQSGAVRFSFPQSPNPFAFLLKCQKYFWFNLCTDGVFSFFILFFEFILLKVLDKRSVCLEMQTVYAYNPISQRRKKTIHRRWKKTVCFFILLLFLFDSDIYISIYISFRFCFP